MADISITAANVIFVSGTKHNSNTAGETITAGHMVYLKASDSKWWKADNNVDQATSGYGVQTGIALHGAAAGQPLVVQTTGDITIGATVAVGVVYVLSTTAGGLAPHADLVSTNYITYGGYAITTGRLRMINAATGLQVA